jgi:hypothetical protein
MVLLSLHGLAPAQIAALLDCHPATVRRWISRFNAEGMAGLADRPRCGRPRLGGRQLTNRIAALLARPGPWALPRIRRYLGWPAISMRTLYRGSGWWRSGGGPSNPGFPSAAVYISESGGDSRVPGISSGSLTIIGNNFLNNWGGVTVYENANRYCSSSANSSTGVCTLGNPFVATLTTCANANLLTTAPYINDCRWKSQNVTVSNNTFAFTPQCRGLLVHRRPRLRL